MYMNISRIYWIYFHRGFKVILWVEKDRNYIDFISFNVKYPNVYTHVHFPTVVIQAFSESTFAGLARLQYQR